ncbi:gypsy type transposase [Tanacetum coccineum]
MVYSFYYTPKNKVLVSRNVEFLENSLRTQEASRSLEDLEIIPEEDTRPSIDTSLHHKEDDLEIDEPQSDIIPIRRSTRTRRLTDRMFLYIDAEEHELGDLGEPANYKAVLLDPESAKWLNAMNVEMQSMKDNEVWDLVDLPPNSKTVSSKWLFKKKNDMDGVVHTYKALQFHLNAIKMDLLSFIRTRNPTKVRVGKRKHDEHEPKLLDATVGRVVPLLLIAPARGESELEDSMDKLFGEGGSRDQVEQGDSTSGGQGVGIQFVSEAAEVQLRDDHGTLSGASEGGKSRSLVQRLLARAVQNAEVRGEIVPTLPFVTSSVSAMPEREDETHTDSMAGTNLQTFGPPPRFVISLNSSHHSDPNVAEAEVDSIVRSSVPVMTTSTTVTATVDATTVLKETTIKPSLFDAGSSSASGNEPILGGFFDLTGNDFLVGGIHTVINPDSDLQKVYVPQWNVTNGSRLNDGGVCREMIDEFAPPKFFTSI